MDIYLVFNELSALDGRKDTNANEYTAREWMKNFVDVLTSSRHNNIIGLKTYSDFFETELLRDYSINVWLGDGDVDRDQKRRVRSEGTKYQYLKRAKNPDVNTKLPQEIQDAEEKMLEYEFYCDGDIASGIGSAHLLESIAVSLTTTERWNLEEVSINFEQFDELEDDIIEEVAAVKHVSLVEHLDRHKEWCQDRFITSVRDGEYLLDKSVHWFNQLVFIDDVKQQILDMTSGTPQLRQVVLKLFELQNYCDGWNTGGFDKDLLASKVSPESKSVRDDPSLRNQRVFKLPDGSEGFFEWHVRLTPDAWRLHFLPENSRRRIYVGYIGKKLPTKKYKT